MTATLPRQTGAPRAADARHPVVLWTFDDDREAPGFVEALRGLGASAIQRRVEDDGNVARGAGLDWYADHAAKKGLLGLRDGDSKPAWERAWAERTSDWPSAAARERPSCLRSAAVIEAMRAATAANVKWAGGAAGDRAPLWISLEDEPSMTVRANPADWCLCDTCVAAFRAAQEQRFGGDIAALNATWGTDYATFADVRPWTTRAIRSREIAKPPSRWNLAPWVATRVFQDASFAETVARLTDGVPFPVGLTGTQAPSAFGGFDYARLLPAMTFVEPYDIGLAMAICRDLPERPGGAASASSSRTRVLAQTIFPSADVRIARLRMWRGIARGANASIVWSSRDALKRGAAGFERTPYGEMLSAEIARLGGADGLGARLARCRPVDEGIAVLLSQDSVRVRWMLDSVPDGDTWMRRFGSYEAAHSTAIRSRDAAWKALAQRGRRFVAAEAVTETGVPAAGAEGGARVVVAPDLIALPETVARGLTAATRGGVLVVSDVAPGAFDGEGRARTPGIPGMAVDPGFVRLADAVETRLGPPILRATAVRDDGGAAPVIEVGLYTDGARTYAVCVPMWDLASADDGSVAGSVPATRMRVTFTFGDGVAKPVRDEFTATAAAAVAPVATWTVSCDAADPLVWSW